MTDIYRILTLQDYGKVRSVFDSIFPSKYLPEFAAVWCQRATPWSFGVFHEDELKGFVVCRVLAEGHLRIEFLGVHPKFQKEGIGTMLLKHVFTTWYNQVVYIASRQSRDDVFQFATEFRISLIPVDNPKVISWYQKFGFTFSGEVQENPWTGELEKEMMFRNQSLLISFRNQSLLISFRNQHPS